MKKYYLVAHANVVAIPKSKELNSDSLTVLLDDFIIWKYENSWLKDSNGEYFHNEELNINKLYFKDENALLINTLFGRLFTFYANKLENDKCLDIGDYDIIIKEDI